MTISLNIPFIENNNSGVLQYLKNKNLHNNVLFEYSSVTDQDHLPNKIFTLDESFFCTVTNTNLNSNYLTIDLKNIVIYPKGYVIRSHMDTDSYYLKSWKLYGSLLGLKWTQIHSVDNKDDLKGGNVGRYKISRGPFKYFKIVQTGKSAGTTNDQFYRLRVAYIDFFGYVTNSEVIEMQKTCKTNAHSFSHSIILIILISNYQKR